MTSSPLWLRDVIRKESNGQHDNVKNANFKYFRDFVTVARKVWRNKGIIKTTFLSSIYKWYK